MTDTIIRQAGDALPAHATTRQPGFDEKPANKNDALSSEPVTVGANKDDQIEIKGGLANNVVDYDYVTRRVIEDERRYTRQHFQKVDEVWEKFKSVAFQKYQIAFRKRVKTNQLWQTSPTVVEKNEKEYQEAKAEYEANHRLYEKNQSKHARQSIERLEDKNLSTVVTAQLKSNDVEKNKKRQDILSVLSDPQLLVSKLDNLAVILNSSLYLNFDKDKILNLAIEKLQLLFKELLELETSIKANYSHPPLSPELQDKLSHQYLEYQSKRIEFLNQFDAFKQNIHNFTVGQQSELARAANELAPFLNATLNNLSCSVTTVVEHIYPDRTAIQASLTELFDRHETACQPWQDLINAADAKYKLLEKTRDDLVAQYKQQASPERIEPTIKKYQQELDVCEEKKQQAQKQIAEFIKQHEKRLAVLNTQLEKTCGVIQNEIELKESLIEFKALHKILADKTQRNDKRLKRMKARLYIVTQQIWAAYENGVRDMPANREEAAEFATYLAVLKGSFRISDPLWGEFHKTGLMTTLRLNVRRTLSAVTDAAHKTINPFFSMVLTVLSVAIYGVELVLETIHLSKGSTKIDSNRTNRIANATIWTGLNAEGFDAAASPLAGCATTTGGLAGFDFPIELKQNRIDLKAGRERLKKMRAELADIEASLQFFDRRVEYHNLKYKISIYQKGLENCNRFITNYPNLSKDAQKESAAQLKEDIEGLKDKQKVLLQQKPELENSRKLSREEIAEVNSLRKKHGDLKAEIPVTQESIDEVKAKRYKVTAVAAAFAVSGAISTTGYALTATGTTVSLSVIGSGLSTVGTVLGIKGLVAFGAFIAGSVASGGILVIAAAAMTAAVSLVWLGYRFCKWLRSKTDAQTLAENNRPQPAKVLSMDKAEYQAKQSMKPTVAPSLPATLSIPPTPAALHVVPVRPSATNAVTPTPTLTLTQQIGLTPIAAVNVEEDDTKISSPYSRKDSVSRSRSSLVSPVPSDSDPSTESSRNSSTSSSQLSIASNGNDVGCYVRTPPPLTKANTANFVVCARSPEDKSAQDNLKGNLTGGEPSADTLTRRNPATDFVLPESVPPALSQNAAETLRCY